MRGKIDVPELERVLEDAGVDEVRYHHISEKAREPGGPATACVLFHDGEHVADSISFLHPKDQFCRKIGRIVALRHAIQVLDVKHRRTG